MYTLRRQRVWKPAEELPDVPELLAALELSEVLEPLAVPAERPERVLAVPALKDAEVQERAPRVFRLPEAWAVTADAAVQKPASSFLLEESALPDAGAVLALEAVTELAEPALAAELELAVELVESE